MLAARISFPHFSISLAMSLPKSAGEPTRGVPPRLASRDFISGSIRAALAGFIAVLSIAVGLLTVLSAAGAADLPRKEPPPVAAAPIGKYPVGKYPVGKYPVGKYPQPVVTKG
jgi:hypothetical protein